MTSLEAAQRIAKAVLYEGYLLYPYTHDSVKNRQRWTFGGIYPPSFTARSPIADSPDRPALRCECLVEGGTRITARLRFLHLVPRRSPDGEYEEGIERERVFGPFELGRLANEPFSAELAIPADFEGQRPLAG